MSERRILDADRYRLSNWEFKCGTATEDDYHLGLFSDETVFPLPSPRNANLFPLIYYKHLFIGVTFDSVKFHFKTVATPEKMLINSRLLGSCTL